LNDTVVIRNHQRAVPVNARQLDRFTRLLLHVLLNRPDAILGVHLLRPEEMTRLNETYLRHRGPTDVITFNYAEAPPHVSASAFRSGRKRRARETSGRAPATPMHGEIFICPAEAVAQARRYRTNWPAELVRCVIHGVLHLDGFDDRRPADRRRMKREEDRLLRELGRRLTFLGLIRRS
jgi:probable rRNA maturation factor